MKASVMLGAFLVLFVAYTKSEGMHLFCKYNKELYSTDYTLANIISRSVVPCTLLFFVTQVHLASNPNCDQESTNTRKSY